MAAVNEQAVSDVRKPNGLQYGIVTGAERLSAQRFTGTLIRAIGVPEDFGNEGEEFGTLGINNDDGTLVAIVAFNKFPGHEPLGIEVYELVGKQVSYLEFIEEGPARYAFDVQAV